MDTSSSSGRAEGIILEMTGLLSYRNSGTCRLLGTYELRDHMGCEQEMKDNIANLKETGGAVDYCNVPPGEERRIFLTKPQVSSGSFCHD